MTELFLNCIIIIISAVSSNRWYCVFGMHETILDNSTVSSSFTNTRTRCSSIHLRSMFLLQYLEGKSSQTSTQRPRLANITNSVVYFLFKNTCNSLKSFRFVHSFCIHRMKDVDFSNKIVSICIPLFLICHLFLRKKIASINFSAYWYTWRCCFAIIKVLTWQVYENTV